jgi:PAS domain S-box-containing protein
MDNPAPSSKEVAAELERLRADNRALADENAALRTARDESQRSEQRYRLITENTLDLICEVSQHGFYTYVSPNHEEILGYRPKELLGHNFSTLIHGDDVAQVVERFSECIVAGIPFVCSFRLRHRDGSWHWVEVSAKPLESAHSAGGGSPYEGQAVFVYRDVTERRETRRALSAETERLKVTLSSITDGVISTDLAGGVVEANEAALHLIGLKRETLLGTSIDEHLEFVDEMTRMPVRSPVIRALTEAVPCTLPLSGHTLLRTKIGLEFAVAGSAAPIRDQEDQLVGSVLIFRNITEKRRTERELLKLSKQESLGQLAARIAHDFNNLLTVILGNLSLTKILLAPGDAALRRLADTEKACLRAKDLTRQLLAFARGGLPVKKPLALEPLVRESTRLILQDANVAYRLNWPDQLPQVNADAEQLHQLLYELLTNAMHATPIGGSIHVRGETLRLNAEATVPLPEGDYVRLSVRDEGLGIPEQHLTRIFEPFFSTKENARGLGLATCFLIARNHEGFMTVDSAPGFGTTFYLYLPALPAFAPAPVVSADPPWVAPAPPRRVSTIDEFSDPYAPMRVAPGAADTRRILVMDDEQPICELAAELLSREGYAVETALDGAEAIRKYQDARIAGQPYDVVILDLTVRGGMGGRETAMKLAEIDPGVRAIVSSGYSQDLMMSRFREFGFCGVVSKPYSVSELTQEIQQAIAGARK